MISDHLVRAATSLVRCGGSRSTSAARLTVALPSAPDHRRVAPTPVARYFPADTSDCPTFVGDSEWHPLVDGAEYLRELDAALRGLRSGDSVQMCGLAVDPTVDLAGRPAGDPQHDSLAERLATLAAAGVTVRIMMAARVIASRLPGPALGGFRTNVQRASAFRTARPAGLTAGAPPPLHASVLLDYSGALVGSNHAKVVVVVRSGVATAFVGGIDLVGHRLDAQPHNRMSLSNRRWGWHDAAVRLRGPAAARVSDVLGQRWQEAATLPAKLYPRRDPARLVALNPPVERITPIVLPAQPAVPAGDTAVRILRSIYEHKVDSFLPFRRREWDALPPAGVHEVYETLRDAIEAAGQYVYVEDQYLQEWPGGRRRFELYPQMVAAARRGVKVVLVGSGVRDPEDPGLHWRPINRRVNRHLRRRLLAELSPADRRNVVVYRVDHLTVHSKLVLVDDQFACIGSANLFSRSMSGVDSEVSTAVATSASLVRDLRVRVWAEHLRTSVTDELRPALEDLTTALGIWDPGWRRAGAPTSLWRAVGQPAGFAPTESVLRRVPSGR
ncbi:MAG: phosphatidylserine/phosphatidylglycerophosphate/cardiolipin synthase family protein [Actinobacteria bacterium]|nr:phosphatidylserine/phosphatidylglycerophosphate/cardiolipin synthase family protein [Actinomycetota bacterium]